MSEIRDLLDRIAAAGLPAEDLTSRRAHLPVPIQELHQRILSAIATAGQAPASAEVQQWAHELGVEAGSALGALAEAELVFLAAPGSGEGSVPAVTGGVPFAGGDSVHRVRIAGGPEVRANCAVDALGIGAMVGRDIQVRSTDPLTGQAVTATSADRTWTFEPATAVVFVGSNGSGRPLTESCCPVINFFADEANARAYQERHHLEGDVLSLPEAAQAGALVFGHLLREPAAGPPTTRATNRTSGHDEGIGAPDG